MSYGWQDTEYADIISNVMKKQNEALAIDISSPPGTRKTRNLIRYAVNNKVDMVAAFPTHVNQEQALTYLLDTIEEKGAEKLDFFVIDYGGMENYCVFYFPDKIMKLLDRFREPGEKYIEAVDKFLGSPVVSASLIAAKVTSDELWYDVARAIDEYAETRDEKQYRKRIEEIINKYGRSELCKVCPVKIFFQQYRNAVRDTLATPKVITWRKQFYKKALAKYKTASKHLVLADPLSIADNFDALSRGRLVLESVLCPRLLLMSQTTKSKSGKPTFIVARRSMILTPHAGLDFVVSVIRKRYNMMGLKPRHILFIDEYDALIRPVKWPLYPLSALDALVNVADEVIETGIGGYVKGIEIDDYMVALAEYAKAVATRVRDIVWRSIRTGEYHPLVNIFVEGAFSSFDEKTLKAKVHYYPLSPRPVHIKHFAGDDTLSLIMSPRPFFEELMYDDPNWRLNIQIADSLFTEIATVDVPSYEYAKIRGTDRKTKHPELLPRRKLVKMNVYGLLKTLRSYVKPLLERPVYAVYYVFESENEIRLASIDVSLNKIFRMKGILVSASPVPWAVITKGVRVDVKGIYERLPSDSAVSTYMIAGGDKREYMDREETHYMVVYKDYDESYRAELVDAVKSGVRVPPPRIVNVRSKIIQISIKTSQAMQYSSNIRIFYVPLPPLEPLREQAIREYIRVISLLRSKRRGYMLVFTQNKETARRLKDILGAEKCRREKCGPNIRKITHYTSHKYRIDITWFRSRAERGIDLPHDYSTMIVVGSPYPRPTYIAGADAGFEQHLTTMVTGKTVYVVRSINTHEKRLVTIAHIPLDIFNGIAALTQSVGRAARSAMRSGTPALVVLPAYLSQKVNMYAPSWMRVVG